VYRLGWKLVRRIEKRRRKRKEGEKKRFGGDCWKGRESSWLGV